MEGGGLGISGRSSPDSQHAGGDGRIPGIYVSY
jgi:hypothetical protein